MIWILKNKINYTQFYNNEQHLCEKKSCVAGNASKMVYFKTTNQMPGIRTHLLLKFETVAKQRQSQNDSVMGHTFSPSSRMWVKYPFIYICHVNIWMPAIFMTALASSCVVILHTMECFYFIWATILQVLIFLSNVDGLVPVITAHLGETTTLTCKLPDTKDRRNKLFWYRQTAGHSLEVVVKLISLANPEYGAGYSDSRVKPVLTDNVSNLTILKAAQEDEGMYHCGFSDWSQNVWRGTYLLIKGNVF